MNRLDYAMQRMESARAYTLSLLDGLSPEEWFRQPHEGVTHIAWQIGHLAMAEYRLALDRFRGERPEDADLIPPRLLQIWGKGSTPDPDPDRNPTVDETLAVLHRVRAQSLRELRTLHDAQLDETVLKPHRLFTKKFDSLVWCAQHEFIHAGQIGLLRRLMGKPPIW